MLYWRHGSWAGLKIRYLPFEKDSLVFSVSPKGMLGIARKGFEIKTENIFTLLRAWFVPITCGSGFPVQRLKKKNQNKKMTEEGEKGHFA